MLFFMISTDCQFYQNDDSMYIILLLHYAVHKTYILYITQYNTSRSSAGRDHEYGVSKGWLIDTTGQ